MTATTKEFEYKAPEEIGLEVADDLLDQFDDYARMAGINAFGAKELFTSLIKSRFHIVGVAIKFGELVVSLPAPNRHHDVIRHLAGKGWKTPIMGVQGFVDGSGKFLTRRQAAIRIYELEAQGYAQALRSQTLNHALGVFSEDLW